MTSLNLTYNDKTRSGVVGGSAGAISRSRTGGIRSRNLSPAPQTQRISSPDGQAHFSPCHAGHSPRRSVETAESRIARPVDYWRRTICGRWWMTFSPHRMFRSAASRRSAQVCGTNTAAARRMMVHANLAVPDSGDLDADLPRCWGKIQNIGICRHARNRRPHELDSASAIC